MADSLSCYFSSDVPDKYHGLASYMNADAQLDPEADDLPIARTELIRMNVKVMPMDETFTRPRDRIEERELLLKELSTNLETRDKPTPSLNLKDEALQLALKQLPGLTRMINSSWRS